MKNILLLEDEDNVNRAIAFTLEKEGYKLFCCSTMKEAAQAFKENPIQLIICDISLPDGSGLDFIRRIRPISDAHIIFLTALDQEMDQILGYEAGADDYITKPFSLAVLTLKVRAFFMKHSETEQVVIKSGTICFYIREMRVKIAGTEVALTKNELKMLKVFMENPKQILSKNQLLQQIFDFDGDFVDENTLAVNISRLRQKIEPDTSKPQYIKNVRGIGYIWDEQCTRN